MKMKRRSPLQRELISQFYRKNRISLAVAIANSLVTGLLNLILSWIMQQLIDTISGVPGAQPLGTLAWACAGLGALCVLCYLLSYVSEPRFIRRAMLQYKDFAFQKLTEKSISSFQAENSAVYLSALTNDAATVETDYLAQKLSVITKLVTFAGALIMMLLYSPMMTVIALCLTLLPFLASVLTGNRLERTERSVSERNAGFTASLKDCLSGFSVVKSFRAEREIFRLFAESNAALEQEKFTKRRIKNIVGMIGTVTGVTAQLGVFLVGAFLALSGSAITAGVVIVFVNLMNFLIQPVAELPGLLASRKAALGLTKKLADALEKDADAPKGDKTAQLQNALALRGVSFGYEPEKEILHGISTVFESGRSYAIVGSSGSGKSTLLNLLMGNNRSYGGSILYDGTELRELSSESLFELISVIQQNVFVFNASIRDNITMFRDFPPEEVEEAIRRAHLTELIAERGEDYLCGENGQGLSGGEKQRISIARSLLKKSSVLLVDEATAALDAKTAHQVSADLLSLKGMTRIVITHALDGSLLRQYDGILAMKDGSVLESGTFDELIARKGYFYALYTVAQ